MNVLDYGSVAIEADHGIVLCRYGLGVVRFATSTSALTELHLAMAFLAQCMGWRWSECVLPQLLPVVSILALALTVLESLIYDVAPDSTGWCTQRRPRDLLCVVLLGSCFMTSIVAYIATLRQSWCCPDSVVRVCWRRAAAYPLNFILTQALIIVVIVDSKERGKKDLLQIAAVTLQNLMGFMNMLTYAMQSRYAVQLLPTGTNRKALVCQNIRIPDVSDKTKSAKEVSYRVRIGGVTVCEVLDRSSYDTCTASNEITTPQWFDESIEQFENMGGVA